MAALAEIVKSWELLSAECRRYRYMARDVELQRDAIGKLESFYDSVEAGRQSARSRGQEDEANQWLSLQSIVHALMSELRMFVALKEDQTSEAWDQLVSAQNAAHGALMASPGAVSAEPYLAQLIRHEDNLFPPQMFISPGMVVGRSHCSICQSPYGECVHVAGRAYAGEFCARIITEIAEVAEISVVTEPKDKRRRVISITAEGVNRDYLTWRPL